MAVKVQKQTQKQSEFESHDPCEQTVVFVIEWLDYSFKWQPAESKQFRTAGGKFIIYDPFFIAFLNAKNEGPMLEFTDEAMAVQLAKALARVTERPLRVERVQNVRIQRQIGKVILPTGGI